MAVPADRMRSRPNATKPRKQVRPRLTRPHSDNQEEASPRRLGLSVKVGGGPPGINGRAG
jgi:hypothetical protein